MRTNVWKQSCIVEWVQCVERERRMWDFKPVRVSEIGEVEIRRVDGGVCILRELVYYGSEVAGEGYVFVCNGAEDFSGCEWTFVGKLGNKRGIESWERREREREKKEMEKRGMLCYSEERKKRNRACNICECTKGTALWERAWSLSLWERRGDLSWGSCKEREGDREREKDDGIIWKWN